LGKTCNTSFVSSIEKPYYTITTTKSGNVECVPSSAIALILVIQQPGASICVNNPRADSIREHSRIETIGAIKPQADKKSPKGLFIHTQTSVFDGSVFWNLSFYREYLFRMMIPRLQYSMAVSSGTFPSIESSIYLGR
jgi:hypothetical protein